MTAFGVILALFVVTVLLWLSMRRHLGRIHFDSDGRADGGTIPEAPDTPAPDRRDMGDA
jgi:hypothetical protein